MTVIDATGRLEAVAADLNAAAEDATPARRLKAARQAIVGKFVFTTSFGLEDQMATHAVAARGLDVAFATLDTGRLFPETYDVWAETEARYGIAIQAFAPETGALEALVAKQGVNGFRRSVEARKACCFVRKVAPLNRALDGASAWITGLRAEQSAGRAATRFAEVDAEREILKLNPLYDWDLATLERHIRALEIPYNALHDQGFPSIGCQPCTRAVRVGEDLRAGRWWWEASDQECGLHVAKSAEAKSAETERSETEPSETKPSETKPSEIEPASPRPAEKAA